MAAFASILRVIKIANTNSAVHDHYHNAERVGGGLWRLGRE
jgi:hypothetical protein